MTSRKRASNNEAPPPLLSRAEALKLSLATAYGLHPQRVCEADTDPAVEWATDVRADELLFISMLEEVLIPVDFADGEPTFGYHPEFPRPHENVEEAIRSRSRDKSTRSHDDVEKVLNEAVRLGAEASGAAPEEMKQRLIDWVEYSYAQCQLLKDVLAGRLLPVPEADGKVSFRSADELSSARRKQLRAGLQRIDRAYVQLSN